MILASRLLQEGRLVWRNFSGGYSVTAVGVNSVGMRCDGEELRPAIAASYTSASFCSGAGGAVCNLPLSMPRDTVTRRLWAPLCCLIRLIRLLWRIV